MRKILFLTTLLAFIFTSLIWAADISGTWILKYTGQAGDERSLDMVIKAAGENLTIATKHPSLGDMTGTGTLIGNDITMTLTSNGERQVGFELKGTVTGNKMAGTREVKAPERDPGDSSGRSSGGPPGDSSGRSSGGPPGDSSGRSSGGPPGDSSGRSSGGPPGGAPGGDSGDAPRQATSNAWTAEKK
jgi:hypothetical protein